MQAGGGGTLHLAVERIGGDVDTGSLSAARRSSPATACRGRVRGSE